MSRTTRYREFWMRYTKSETASGEYIDPRDSFYNSRDGKPTSYLYSAHVLQRGWSRDVYGVIGRRDCKRSNRRWQRLIAKRNIRKDLEDYYDG